MPGPSRELVRSQLFGRAVNQLTGSVLELGVGRRIEPGRYAPDTRVTAVDVSLRRMRHARRSAARALEGRVYLVAADAARLPFSDSSFDGIVASFLLCSVESLDAVSKEMARVARPGAPIAILEHIRSKNVLFGALQDAATPLYRRACNNCHLNRTPRLSLEEHGFFIADAQVTHHFIPWLFLSGYAQKES